MRRRDLVLAAFVAVLGAVGCAPRGPEPIALGSDPCAYCKMIIADARFGGEVRTRTGRVLAFDSIECLADWMRAAPAGEAAATWVIDLQHPGTLVRADSAGFLIGAMIPSPMGRAIVAFATPKAAEEQRAMLGGRVAGWAALLADTTRVRGTP
ncbi:MAG: nitrous oxide reductase accessory protein NosL [Gemmatimonadetes bacterium]|nr:nitrous oxide reductase accessory protein NosL [Gemmatimonadota bacterium]